MNCVNHCQNHQNASENITIHNQREKVPESCRACDISCWVHMNALSTTKFQKKTNAQNQCYVYKKYNFCNENEIPCMAINGFVLTKMNFNQISKQRWVNCYRNHDVLCALMLCMYTYLFVLNLTILNSWVSLYSLMSTTLPKEWRKTGQQTSLIFKIHHSN